MYNFLILMKGQSELQKYSYSLSRTISVMLIKIDPTLKHWDRIENEKRPKQKLFTSHRQRFQNIQNQCDIMIAQNTKKNQWSEEQEEMLFNLHSVYGNRWSIIAAKMPNTDRTDNCIKNKFYSTLRKGLRKMNKYIGNIKKKIDVSKKNSIKELQPLFLTKLMAVADRNYEQKLQVKETAIKLSQEIQKKMLQIAKNDQQYAKVEQKQSYENEQKLLQEIQQFNRNCKRRKGKRKMVADGKSDKGSDDDKIDQQIIEDQNLLSLQKNETQNNKELKENQQKKMITQLSLPSIDQEFYLGKKIQINVHKADKIEEITENKKVSTFRTFENNFNDEFLKFTSGQCLNFIDNCNPNTPSGQSTGWLYQSTTTNRQLSKRLSTYLTEPSPYPTDNNSPYSFTSMLGYRNITASNMFDENSVINSSNFCNSDDLIKTNAANSSFSFLDTIPIINSQQQTKNNQIFRSTNLKKEGEGNEKLFNNSCQQLGESNFILKFPRVNTSDNSEISKSQSPSTEMSISANCISKSSNLNQFHGNRSTSFQSLSASFSFPNKEKFQKEGLMEIPELKSREQSQISYIQICKPQPDEAY